MSGQLKAFQKSFLIHMVAVLAVVGIAGSTRQFSRPLVIDFTLENAAVNNGKTYVEKEAQPPSPRTAEPLPNVQSQIPPPPREIAAPPPLPPIPAPALSEAQAPVMAPKSAQVPAPPAIAAKPADTRDIVDYAATQHASAPVSRQAVNSGPPGGGGPAASAESVRSEYLKKNFAYIMQIVQKKATYPAVARRLGLEGRVKVSFVVSADGNISELKVVNSSGKKMLDEGAVEAVRKSAPFPPPHVEMLLSMPVAYNLN